MSSTFLTTDTSKAIAKVKREDALLGIYLLFGGSMLITATVFVAMEYWHRYGLLFLVAWAVFCVGVPVFLLIGFIAWHDKEYNATMWCVRGFVLSLLCGAYPFWILLANHWG